MLYVGKVEKEALESVPAYYVRKLSQCNHGINRNVTVGTLLASVPLADLCSINTVLRFPEHRKEKIYENIVIAKGKMLVLLCTLLMDRRHYYPTPLKSMLLFSTVRAGVTVGENT